MKAREKQRGDGLATVAPGFAFAMEFAACRGRPQLPLRRCFSAPPFASSWGELIALNQTSLEAQRKPKKSKAKAVKEKAADGGAESKAMATRKDSLRGAAVASYKKSKGGGSRASNKSPMIKPAAINSPLARGGRTESSGPKAKPAPRLHRLGSTQALTEGGNEDGTIGLQHHRSADKLDPDKMDPNLQTPTGDTTDTDDYARPKVPLLKLHKNAKGASSGLSYKVVGNKYERRAVSPPVTLTGSSPQVTLKPTNSKSKIKAAPAIGDEGVELPVMEPVAVEVRSDGTGQDRNDRKHKEPAAGSLKKELSSHVIKHPAGARDPKLYGSNNSLSKFSRQKARREPTVLSRRPKGITSFAAGGPIFRKKSTGGGRSGRRVSKHRGDLSVRQARLRRLFGIVPTKQGTLATEVKPQQVEVKLCFNGASGPFRAAPASASSKTSQRPNSPLVVAPAVGVKGSAASTGPTASSHGIRNDQIFRQSLGRHIDFDAWKRKFERSGGAQAGGKTSATASDAAGDGDSVKQGSRSGKTFVGDTPVVNVPAPSLSQNHHRASPVMSKSGPRERSSSFPQSPNGTGRPPPGPSLTRTSSAANDRDNTSQHGRLSRQRSPMVRASVSGSHTGSPYHSYDTSSMEATVERVCADLKHDDMRNNLRRLMMSSKKNQEGSEAGDLQSESNTSLVQNRSLEMHSGPAGPGRSGASDDFAPVARRTRSNASATYSRGSENGDQPGVLQVRVPWSKRIDVMFAQRQHQVHTGERRGSAMRSEGRSGSVEGGASFFSDEGQQSQSACSFHDPHERDLGVARRLHGVQRQSQLSRKQEVLAEALAMAEAADVGMARGRPSHKPPGYPSDKRYI